ncbi:hypothetical protein EDB84DRAFT_1435864 [Lactarius hengduanensis]|nr:hypothetical protein EDB84DRAFT_1435864 [Lactarius hengduanensis]
MSSRRRRSVWGRCLGRFPQGCLVVAIVGRRRPCRLHPTVVVPVVESDKPVESLSPRVCVGGAVDAVVAAVLRSGSFAHSRSDDSDYDKGRPPQQQNNSRWQGDDNDGKMTTTTTTARQRRPQRPQNDDDHNDLKTTTMTSRHDDDFKTTTTTSRRRQQQDKVMLARRSRQQQQQQGDFSSDDSDDSDNNNVTWFKHLGRKSARKRKDRSRLGLDRSRLVSTGLAGLIGLPIFRKHNETETGPRLAVLIGLDNFRSRSVRVWSSLSLFPVLRLDFQTLIQSNVDFITYSPLLVPGLPLVRWLL